MARREGWLDSEVRVPSLQKATVAKINQPEDLIGCSDAVVSIVHSPDEYSYIRSS